MNTIPKGCKPFNLQECMAGKPVVTRDGRPYKFGAYNPDAKVENQKITGWIDNWIVVGHNEDGVFCALGTINDLFMKAKKTVYTAVYKNAGGNIFGSSAYDSVEKLKQTLGSFFPKAEIIKIHETEVEL